jgi:pyrroloquinoline quinone biosynthesis protein B
MMTAPLSARLAGAACVMFDGTLFTDDEMIRLGAGPKTGRRMGHMPMTGAGSTLEAFADIPVKRRIFVHINNTNPALLADSPERAMLAAAGWEVAEDGMEFRL